MSSAVAASPSYQTPQACNFPTFRNRAILPPSATPSGYKGHTRKQARMVPRCASSKGEYEDKRYPNIPRLDDWVRGDGTRRLAAWEEAELPIPGYYQERVASRDHVVENAHQFKKLQQHMTVDGNNYTVIRELGKRADRDYYNNLPERLRYGPQPYMAATDEYEEFMANKLIEVEPIFQKEVKSRIAASQWLGAPSGRERRLQKYRARRAEVEGGQQKSA